MRPYSLLNAAVGVFLLALFAYYAQLESYAHFCLIFSPNLSMNFAECNSSWALPYWLSGNTAVSLQR